MMVVSWKNGREEMGSHTSIDIRNVIMCEDEDDASFLFSPEKMMEEQLEIN